MGLQKYFTKGTWNVLNLLNFMFITGFSIGLIIATLQISNNHLFHHKLYNLVLFDLQDTVTKYILVFVSITLTVLVLNTVAKLIFNSVKLKSPIEAEPGARLSYALNISLFLFIFLVFIYSTKYPNIINLRMGTFIADALSALNIPKHNGGLRLIVVLSLSAIPLISISTYILYKLNLAFYIEKYRLRRAADSRIIQSLGLVIIGLVIIYNVAVYGYKHLNTPEGPNIVLISIDTLRVDHLGVYGYKRDTTPNIDELAEKGILFENAVSQAPWTLPSMASMHTSLYPIEHGAFSKSLKLRDNTVMLAEYMKNNYYKTIAVVTNILLTDKYGFSQGFDIYNQTIKNNVSSNLITERAIEYVSKNRENKFFLWLHYLDPHGMYRDHSEFEYSSNYSGFPVGFKAGPNTLNSITGSINDQALQYVIDLYDEEISFTDKHIGRLIDYLDKIGLSENTIIILTSDHGEEFMERKRFGHGKSLYQELIHVPLIIYDPTGLKYESKRVKSNVEVRDIPKTILDLCGIKNSAFGGNNLKIIAEEDNQTGPSYSDVIYYRGDRLDMKGIVANDFKLINNMNDQTYELYDLQSDSQEKVNLIESEQEKVIRMKKDLLSELSELKLEIANELETTKLSKEEIAELKALGYIQ